MIVIKKLTGLDEDEVFYEKTDSYFNQIKFISGVGEFSEFSKLFNLQKRIVKYSCDLDNDNAIVVICKSEDWIDWIKFLKDTTINFVEEDLTNQYNLGILDFSNLQDFETKIEKFLLKNLSIDDVLDKVNLKGIESLSEIEKSVLIKN